MKTLVVGCSFSDGWGFENGIQSPLIWPNLLANTLKTEITNYSKAATDNTGIFLNTITTTKLQKFDLILVQWTGLDRVVLSQDDHCSMIHSQNILHTQNLTNKDYEQFYKSFLKLNGLTIHWNRFCQMLMYLQDFPNVYFVNGLVHWSRAMFDSDSIEQQITNNKFLLDLIDIEKNPDDYVQQRWNFVKNQLNQIDLSRWVNPFSSLYDLQSDSVSPTDSHPGPKSHQHYAELIVEFLNHK